MIILYTYLKRFFLNLNGLSDGKALSLPKKEYNPAVHFFYIFVKYLKSISDECISAICTSSLSSEIFIITNCENLV